MVVTADANGRVTSFVDTTGASTQAGLNDEGYAVAMPRINVFKSVSVSAAGNTAVWTPASGKSFRLRRYAIAASGNCVLNSGGTITVGLQDGTTDIGLSHSAFLPSASGNPGYNWFSGWIDLGDGYKSSAVGNVLNANLSVAVAGGVLRILVAGVEE